MGQNVLAPLFDDSDRSELRLSISVVPVETFSETVVAVDVSNCQDLVTCDLGGIVTTRGARRNLLVWQETLSDIVGCIQLRHPAPLAPTAPLKAKDCPVSCLLDELQELGPLSSVLLRTAGATTLWFSMAGTYPARGIIFSACWWGVGFTRAALIRSRTIVRKVATSFHRTAIQKSALPAITRSACRVWGVRCWPMRPALPSALG